MQDDQTVFDVDFSYIGDEKLRTLVQRFHGEAVRAFQSKAYIASVVLSGGVLEGILTFALTTRQTEAAQRYREKHGRKADERPDPRNWKLYQLIDIASSMDLIGHTARRGARAVEDFRNLIHPYNLLQKSEPRWDGLATMALGAIAEISRSLSGRLSPNAEP